MAIIGCSSEKITVMDPHRTAPRIREVGWDDIETMEGRVLLIAETPNYSFERGEAH